MRVTICTCFGSYAHFVMKRETLNVYIVNKRNILHCTGAGSVCEILEGLAVVRAPGDGELQGPSAAAAVLPRSPLRLAENTLIIRWPELWLILAGPMASAINNPSAPSSEADGCTHRGCRADSG